MPYIERDAKGRIVGLYVKPQPGRAEEWLADDDAEVQAFPAPTPEEAAEESRREGFRGDEARRALLERLQTATPGQIDGWVDSNVTNLASAKVVLAGILKVIALDGRE